MSQPSWVTRICGSKARTSGGTTAWNARSQPASPVPGGSATLTAVPSAAPWPDSLGEAGAGEGRVAALVQADGQYPGVAVEGRLHTVAVVGVQIDVGHLLHAVGQQRGDGDGDVVVDAEPGGAGRHRVVQPAGEVDGVLRRAGADRHGGVHGGPGDQRRRLVHPVEDRVVVAAQPERVVHLHSRGGGPRPNRGDIGRFVDELEHVVGRPARCRDPRSGVRRARRGHGRAPS